MKKVPILMYHHVSSVSEATPLKSLFVSPRVFDLQMKVLSFFGYQGKSMRELLPYLDGKKEGKVFGITFDDGYKDVLENALPILNKYGFSSTCYVVSDEVGNYNRWDEGYKDRHNLMDIPDLNTWLNSGQDIGVHTATHVSLLNLQESRYTEEILNPKTKLENFFPGRQFQDFCYPYGDFTPNVVNFIEQSRAYKTATTTVRGVAKAGDNALLLSRVFMKNNMGFVKTFLKVILGIK